MFGDFLKMGLDADERVYEEVHDYARLATLMTDYLEDYNNTHPSTLNLVFFKDALEHITRISRILRQPRGNALLVGVGGSGKSSLTRFAAHMGGFKCFSIELARNYGIVEFREDLKKLYMQVLPLCCIRNSSHCWLASH
jgi:dynein heavy chain, axonemal